MSDSHLLLTPEPEIVCQLVYENDRFVVINKTAALGFHCEQGEAGLFERVKAQLAAAELYPVHRLDKLTTGLVIFAKTRATAAQFGRLFEAHQINKFYLAVSDQKPKKKQGWIKGDMVKARRGAWKLLRSRHNPAVTQFISQPLASAGQPGLRLFLLRPYSGKTHQLRVALKSIGSPILGDSLYYPDDHLAGEEKTVDRGYLHAYGLQFDLDGQSHRFVSFPDSGRWFIAAGCREQLRQHWSEPWTLFG